MAMIEDQIISNVTCDVGKQTKTSSFLKSEEISTKPWGKFHLLFKILPCLLVPYRSVVFFVVVFLMLPFTFSLILLSSFHVFCSQFAIVTLHAVSCSCVHVVRAFLFRWLLCPISIVFIFFSFFLHPSSPLSFLSLLFSLS